MKNKRASTEVEEKLMMIDPALGWVYSRMLTIQKSEMIDTADGRMFPSTYQQISELTGLKKNTIIRIIQKLVDLNLIMVISKGCRLPNMYKIIER